MSSPVSTASIASSNNFKNFVLPVSSKIFNGVNIGTYTVKGNYMSGAFVNIELNAVTGPKSNIVIVKPGAKTSVFSGTVNTVLKLGSDDDNKLPFKQGDTVTILIEVDPAEIVTVNNLTIKENNNFNIQTFIKIFLIVFFIIYLFS
jgi:hypothetical protein